MAGDSVSVALSLWNWAAGIVLGIILQMFGEHFSASD